MKRVLLVALVLAFGGVGYYWFFSIDSLFRTVKEEYDKRHLENAYRLFTQSETKLLQHREGCNLGVSILAEFKQFSALELLSRKCLSRIPVQEIAFDGLAASLQEQGKGYEAITELEAMPENPVYLRRIHALANLYMLNDGVHQARKYYLNLIKAAGPHYAPWLTRLLTLKRVLANDELLSELITLILLQKPSAETKKADRALYEMLQKINLTDQAKRLDGRIQTH